LADTDRLAPTQMRGPLAAQLAVLNAYASLGLGDATRSRRAVELLDLAAQTANEVAPNVSLFEGILTIAYAHEHVGRLLGTQRNDDINADVDEGLIELLEGEDTLVPFDLVAGLSGIGMYALERAETSSGARLLDLVIRRLRRAAQPMNVGCAWRTRAPAGSSADLTAFSQGIYPTGMAHGAAGPIAFLSEAIHRSTVPEAAELLRDALAWMGSQLQTNDDCPVFAISFDPVSGRSIERGRYTWCWGDVGLWPATVGTQYHQTASSLYEAAIRASSAYAAAPALFGDPFDACLCHGACGIGHIFNRLHHHTGRADYERAARWWLSSALNAQRDEGLGGFVFMSDRVNNRNIYTSNTTIIGGVTGVALALIASVSTLPPRWDRLMGLGPLALD